MVIKRNAAKNARKTFSPTTEKRETYPKPGVNARTTAKNASKAIANRTPKPSTISGATPPKATATRGAALKAGTITNNAPKAFVNSKTPTMSSYANKSGATKKKFY